MRGKDGLYDTLCLRAQRAALPECAFNNKTGCVQMEGHQKPTSFLPLNPKIHTQILQIDPHTFLLTKVERIWSKIKAFSLW